jgi:agmatinase
MSTPTFDPNTAAAEGSGVFGLPFNEKDASVVYLPVPWEATTSYGGGASNAPAAILEASAQVDLYDWDVLKPYEAGLYMRPLPKNVLAWNKEGKAAAQKIIKAGGAVGKNAALKAALKTVNDLSGKVNDFVYTETSKLLAADKIVGVIGGDHSTPYGAIKAAAERHPGLGLLHFDAHHDLREAYEGFKHSHASIFHNVLTDVKQVAKLVQVGIRDFCEAELEFAKAQGARVKTYYDGDLSRRKFSGQAWTYLCNEIVENLPDEVWVTFDIDGLDPRFCPHTGTPVPGGLDFKEANFLLGTLVRSGRRIVGFDLNEVCPDPEGQDEWDANVGARLLYKLTGWTLASQEKAKLR